MSLHAVFDRIGFVGGVAMITVALLWPLRSFAANTDSGSTVHLDAKTIARGYSLTTPQQRFELGIPAGSIEGRDRVRATVKPVRAAALHKTKKKNRVSYAYSFDVVDRDSTDPLTVTGPLWLSLSWTDKAPNGYWFGVWDNTNKRWSRLPSTTNENTERIQAAVQVPYGVVALFERKKKSTPSTAAVIEYSGQASWMSSSTGAAMTLLPVGQKIAVTNPATGVTVNTQVITTGPFSPPGRIIDLSADVFAQLAPLSSGVINGIIVTAIDS